MARYETYRSTAAELPVMRKWVIRAFILSLLLHVGLYAFLQFKKLDNFGFQNTPQLVKPLWVVKQAVIDPKLLDQPEKVVIRAEPKAPLTIPVPIDKPEPKELKLSPQTTEISSQLLNDKPQAPPINPDAIARIDAESAGQADRELGSLATALLDKGTRSPRQPIIRVPKVGGEGNGMNEGIPGRQSLDEALTGTGGISGSQQPVAMPGGALFEHDRADLAASALDDLQKLAQLIAKYPHSTFVISGHTDWTGTPDYNQGLSERRANAVKEWLVAHAGISPDRIQTIGKGSSEAIVPPDRSVEEQQPNRRVEIVIKTHAK
jgi:outer membrane protein OmpA-like peptidoglycan-associated protein